MSTTTGALVPETTVAHWNDRPAKGWEYIGRSIGDGYFGNPFMASSRCGHSNYEPMGKAEAIRHYREWFYIKMGWDLEFKRRIEELRGMVLVCHCKPAACHGDIIAEYLNA